MRNLDLYQNRVMDSRKISKSRLVDIKVKTFERALASSYNSELVSIDNEEFQALITSIPTSPKIGKKNFATLRDHECEVGDELYWPVNNSHWLITEHDDTEGSIFQGSMQRALYVLNWKDPITNEVYTTRACVKGPDETTVSDGVKHAIMFDTLTDSLFLIVPEKIAGSRLLRRYFEIMIDGKKWKIEVADESTSDKLIYLQLLETPINRDTDTEELADGKRPNIFKAESVLNGLTSVALGTVVNFDPILLQNGSVVHNEKVNIRTNNCTLYEDSLTFDKLGPSSIRVKFEDYKQDFNWSVDVVKEVEEEVSIREIVGSSKIKTLTSNEYSVRNLINGVEGDVTGEWKFDEDYFTLVEEVENKIILKAKNKTGNTAVEYLELGAECKKDIKIVPLFGRS